MSEQAPLRNPKAGRWAGAGSRAGRGNLGRCEAGHGHGGRRRTSNTQAIALADEAPPPPRLFAKGSLSGVLSGFADHDDGLSRDSDTSAPSAPQEPHVTIAAGRDEQWRRSAGRLPIASWARLEYAR